MKLPAMMALLWVVFATGVAAQPSGPGGASKSKSELAAIRDLVSELQAATETLADYNAQHREAVARKPRSGSQEEHDAWTESFERLLRRMEGARAKVADAEQRANGIKLEGLPLALAKDLAKAKTQASAERANAEQALASKPKKSGKPAKPAPKPAGPPPDIDL
jgi:hypothetical protein